MQLLFPAGGGGERVGSGVPFGAEGMEIPGPRRDGPQEHTLSGDLTAKPYPKPTRSMVCQALKKRSIVGW